MRCTTTSRYLYCFACSWASAPPTLNAPPCLNIHTYMHIKSCNNRSTAPFYTHTHIQPLDAAFTRVSVTWRWCMSSVYSRIPCKAAGYRTPAGLACSSVSPTLQRLVRSLSAHERPDPTTALTKKEPPVAKGAKGGPRSRCPRNGQKRARMRHLQPHTFCVHF